MLPSLSADFDPLSGRLFGPGATVCTTLYYYTTVGYGSMFIFSFCSKESFSPHIRNRTGGFSIEKTYKGHSPEPPTLVVKWMETDLET